MNFDYSPKVKLSTCREHGADELINHPLDRAADALNALLGRQVTGKLVLQIAEAA